MTRERIPFRKVREILIYSTAVLLSMLILIWVLQLWRADITHPLVYSGDALYEGAVIKTIMDYGWYLHNPSLGAPAGLDFHDYPMPETVNFLISKVIALFTDNWAVVFNLLYLLAFPLITITSLIVMRYFNYSALISIVTSLLYAFLPYHFYRSQYHLHLSAYYMIPLMTMVLIWIYKGEHVFFKKDTERDKTTVVITNKKTIFSIIISLLVSSSGVYYAFFSCFLILVSGFAGKFNTKENRSFMASIILVLIISSGLIANISPSICYALKNGANWRSAFFRSPSEAETYGLKITHLLLPVSGHRLDGLRKMKERYTNTAPLLNENLSTTLGIAGNIGFLFLIGISLFKKRKEFDLDENYSTDALGTLNLAAVLLATIGGFGSLFAYNIIASIRGYNRIFVFIAYFSLLAFAFLLEKIRPVTNKSLIQKTSFTVIMFFILLAGVLDQTNDSFIPLYDKVRAEFANDSKFVMSIENKLGKNKMVLQLPYEPFPEASLQLSVYDHLKGYLNSKNLRWSYGPMRGRMADVWIRHIYALKLESMVEELSFLGFCGIYIDRNAYTDKGADIERRLSILLGASPLASDNKRMAFFDIRNFSSRLRLRIGEHNFELCKYKSRHPILIARGLGFFQFGNPLDDKWNWIYGEGHVIVYNLAPTMQRIELDIFPGSPNSIIPCIKVKKGLTKAVAVPFEEGRYRLGTFSIPPGQSMIKIRRCDKVDDVPYESSPVFVFEVKEMGS